MGISLNITSEDLAAAEAGSYSVVPAGSYNATIYEAKLEQVKSGPNEGKPRLNIQFKLTGEGVENRRVFGYVALYKAGDFWKTQAFFKALGYNMQAGTFEVPNPADLAGKPIGVRVKVGKDQDGNDRNEVAGFDAPTLTSLMGSFGATAISAEDVW